ncbi:MAG: DUF6088 family protein [Pseudohongiellaceae bacterium]
MSVSKSVKARVKRMPRGKPFSSSVLLGLGSRAAVDQALSRQVKAGEVKRIARGIYIRPKSSRFIAEVMPEVGEVMNVIAKDNNEIIQVGGAEAANRFGLSTQMPTKHVYYTNGAPREINVGNLRVQLKNTRSPRKLVYAGEKPGMALSALWYLGKGNVNEATIERIRAGMNEKEFEKFKSASMPAWMADAVRKYSSTQPNG